MVCHTDNLTSRFEYGKFFIHNREVCIPCTTIVKGVCKGSPISKPIAKMIIKKAAGVTMKFVRRK